ncbi:MAG: hypothetical protein K2X31_04000, partial [Sphingopyxis sp.]|nr:hypothetical protein [Sphingopyxis sp.]
MNDLVRNFAIDVSGKMVRYEAARAALIECKTVDEVKDIADRALALKLYGQQARDKTLEVDAAEIRIRAERRLGEMLTQQKQTVGLNPGAKGIGPIAVVADDRNQKDRQATTPTLKSVGISKDMSARAQAIAAVPAAEFEAEVSEWRGRVEKEGERVTTKLVARGKAAQAARPSKAEPDELDALRAEVEDLREKNA